jgi:peptidoglycan/LPS O-acetylase OafA/YrhL
MDGLRFLAFAAIFLYHADLAKHWFASYSVHLFFALSGFLITGILIDHGEAPAGRVLGVFYARRFLRIFPAYYLTLLVLLPLGRLPYAAWSFTYTFNIKLFLLSAYGGLDPLLSQWKSWGIHLWTLCVEEQFYLLFPVLFVLPPAKWRPFVMLLLLMATIASRVAFSTLMPAGYSAVLLPVSGEYIVWGGLAAFAYRNIPLQKGMASAMITAVILLVVLLLAAGGKPDELAPQFHPSRFQTLYALSFALLLWGLWADDRSIYAKALAFRPFAYLGKISYGLYLAHLFMWDARDALVRQWPAFKDVPPVPFIFLMTVASAAASWHFFESPLNNLKKHFPYPGKAVHAG